MSDRVNCHGLQVASNLQRFVDNEVLPGTGLQSEAFWAGFAALVHDLAPHNRALLAERERLNADIQQVLRLGALGFIPKSVPMKELVSALNTVIGGDNWVPEGISLHPESEDGPDFASKLASLTPQQYKVLIMLRDGSLNKQIAWELNVSEATIKAHITAIFRKLGVKNRTQAVIALQQMDIKDS